MKRPDQAHQRLHEELTGLHEELSNASPVAPADAELVRKLGEDIKALSPGAPGRPGYGTVRSRLAEVMRKFEASHPSLSQRIERLIDQLALLNL